MSRIGPSMAAEWLKAHINVTDAPRDVESLLSEYIGTLDEPNPYTDDELLEKWQRKFVRYVRREINAANTNGDFVPYSFSTSSENFICGCCFIEKKDNEETILSKKRRAKTLLIHKSLRSISPTEFEKLGSSLLNLWQCSAIEITQHSNDQGIDFIGKISLGDFLSQSILPSIAERNLSAWLVGQAKKYDLTSIGTATIRELAGSVLLLRGQAFSKDAVSSSLQSVRICDPIICLMITTGKISRDSRKLLEASGIVALNGKQISMILADNSIGIVDDKFDEETFYDWLNTPVHL